MAEKLTPDQKLLETESPQDQVDRMGNGWKYQEQYDKQLQLPVHLMVDDLVVVEKDGQKMPGYRTACGLDIGADATLRTASDPNDVTCEACKG